MLTSRARKDQLAGWMVKLTALYVCVLAFVILLVLAIKSWPLIISTQTWNILSSDEWRPFSGRFGFRPFILGTLSVTAVAGLIAVPISVLSAVYVVEYCSSGLRRTFEAIVDLMAAVPSVVYGTWGVLVIVPTVGRIAEKFGISSSGYSLLSAAIVLTVMIIPYMAHLCVELFSAVPRGAMEASLSLGAGKWHSVKHVMIRMTMPGIAATVVLALCRALGETMAVLMVAGNVPAIPRSLFDPVYPLPALIANSYGEMMSVPLYESALMFAALLLLIVVLCLSLASRYVLFWLQRKIA